MKRGARDSQVVNNFFSLATIIMVSVVLVLYTKYIVKDESEDSKNSIFKLQCEKDEFSYSKVFNQKLINSSINALNKGYYILDGAFIESLHMKSNIKNIINLSDANEFFIEAIGIKSKENPKKFVKIQYEIIENDKKNPSKKNEESKLNAGSLKTSFIVNSKEIFRFYTDFTFMYKNAIKQRIDCSIKVFKNHVQK